MSEIYGTRRVLGVATLISSLLTLLNPWAAKANVFLLIATRVGIGLAQGVLFPSINPMLLRCAIHE